MSIREQADGGVGRGPGGPPHDGLELCVQATKFDGKRHSIERQHVGGSAVVDRMLGGITGDVVEAIHHDFFEAIIDQLFVPEVALTILDPLEVGYSDAASIGQNVWNDENALVLENGIGAERGGAICAFTQDAGLDTAGIGGGNDVFLGSGQQDIAIEK